MMRDIVMLADWSCKGWNCRPRRRIRVRVYPFERKGNLMLSVRQCVVFVACWLLSAVGAPSLSAAEVRLERVISHDGRMVDSLET